MKLIKYKVFATCDEFVAWQLAENRHILQVSPQGISVQNTDKPEMNLNFGVFVTYLVEVDNAD